MSFDVFLLLTIAHIHPSFTQFHLASPGQLCEPKIEMPSKERRMSRTQPPKALHKEMKTNRKTHSIRCSLKVPSIHKIPNSRLQRQLSSRERQESMRHSYIPNAWPKNRTLVSYQGIILSCCLLTSCCTAGCSILIILNAICHTHTHLILTHHQTGIPYPHSPWARAKVLTDVVCIYICIYIYVYIYICIYI